MIIPDNDTYSLAFSKSGATGIIDDLCSNLTWEYVYLYTPQGQSATLPSSSPGDLGGISFTGSFNKTSISSLYNQAFSIDFWWIPSMYLSRDTGVGPVSVDALDGFKPFYLSGGLVQGSLDPQISALLDVSSTPISLGSVSTANWHHFYFGCDGNDTFYIAIDGIIKHRGTYSGEITSIRDNDFLLGAVKNEEGSSYDYTTSRCEIAAFRISDICRWTEDFIPPAARSSYVEQVLIESMLIKDSANNVWGLNNGSFSQVGTNWDTMSTTIKVNTFESYHIDQITPSMLNSFSGNPVSILFYKENQDQPTVSVRAIPKPQIILPTSLISLSNYVHVDNMTLTAGSGVKVALTKDMTTYYAYQNNQFITIDIADIATQGNTATELNNIPEAIWHTFTENISGIALAYYVSENNIVDELKIQVDEKDQEGIVNNRYTVITKFYNDKNELVFTDTKTFDI